MKITKLLNEVDKKSREKYENVDFLQEIKTDVLVKEWNNRRFVSIFAASLVVIIVAISLICFYCIPKNIYYYSENEIFEVSTLDEVNEKSKEFRIIEQDGYNITCEKTIDKESRTLLSFIVTLIDENELSQLQIRIIINEKFLYSENTDNYSIIEKYDEFSMHYIESIKDEDGLFSFNSKGFIQKNKEKVYISYSELSLEENSGLTKLIGEILIGDSST